jgi:hypothetical protein
MKYIFAVTLCLAGLIDMAGIVYLLVLGGTNHMIGVAVLAAVGYYLVLFMAGLYDVDKAAKDEKPAKAEAKPAQVGVASECFFEPTPPPSWHP